MGRSTTPRGAESEAGLPGTVEGEGRASASDWRRWMKDLGRRQRGLREFLGLSQERLAGLAGVSQGAVSRLETGKGLATPLVVVLKVNAVLASELAKLDPALVGAELRAAVQLQAMLTPSGGTLGFKDVPVAAEPELDELVRLYRETPVRHRSHVLSILRKLVPGLARTAVVALLAASGG
jgi:transcriptional regulator with XRE-family HTH domain